MKRLLTAIALASAALGAQAQFSNTKGVITDATTGMQWLDLKFTYGLSFNDVTEQLDGGIYSGYRYASMQEVKQLFTDAYFWIDSFRYQDSDPIHLTTNDLFFDVFSGASDPLHTYSSEIVQGFVAGGGYHLPGLPDGVSLQSASGVGSGAIGLGFTSTAWTDATAPTTNQGGQFYGSWLVKVAAPVPEPQKYALMLAGLVAVGFAVRRPSI